MTRTTNARQATVRAFAKINLGLRVLYKRPDGYHELRTVFQTISLADRLEIVWNPGKTNEIEMLGTPEIPDTLAARAARLIMDAIADGAAGKALAERRGTIRLRLQKNIPSGAGLGGGSSDAAAVLLSLPVLVGARLPLEKLTELAATLGSDVPFFLYGGTALGLGRGEELYPLPEFPATQALLIASPIHSSTADAYRDVSATLNAGALTNDLLQNKLSSFQSGAWGRGLERNKSSIINDFESVVLARHPQLSGIRERLARCGATRVSMTGSGSAIFGIFDNPGKLERARLAWEQRTVDGERAFAVTFVGRSRYEGAFRRALKEHTKGNDIWPLQSRHAR